MPPNSPTVEREMSELAPKGVSVHIARLVARGPVGTLDSLQSRAASHLAHMDETVEMLASVEPSVIVLAHTATSYYLGIERERELSQRMTEKTGIPFISALTSVVEAFRMLGIRKIAVGTPYDPALTMAGKKMLEDYGLEVVNTICLPNVTNIFEETQRRVYGLGRQADRPDADALFLSGTGMPTVSVIEALEQDLGKPVISSATAMMWNALRIARVGAPVPGYGRLLTLPR
jgi:maleate cis-trans isomerase